jgi:hypothetical protein
MPSRPMGSGIANPRQRNKPHKAVVRSFVALGRVQSEPVSVAFFGVSPLTRLFAGNMAIFFKAAEDRARFSRQSTRYARTRYEIVRTAQNGHSGPMSGAPPGVGFRSTRYALTEWPALFAGVSRVAVPDLYSGAILHLHL